MSKDDISILLLEDSDERVELFDKRFAETFDSWHLTRTVTSDKTIDNLKVNDYNLIFLDHDLTGDETAIKAAQWMADNADKIRQNLQHPVFIHSSNPVGAQNIQDILSGSNIVSMKVPFIWTHAKFNQLVNFNGEDKD